MKKKTMYCFTLALHLVLVGLLLPVFALGKPIQAKTPYLQVDIIKPDHGYIFTVDGPDFYSWYVELSGNGLLTGEIEIRTNESPKVQEYQVYFKELESIEGIQLINEDDPTDQCASVTLQVTNQEIQNIEDYINYQLYLTNSSQVNYKNLAHQITISSIVFTPFHHQISVGKDDISNIGEVWIDGKLIEENQSISVLENEAVIVSLIPSTSPMTYVSGYLVKRGNEIILQEEHLSSTETIQFEIPKEKVTDDLEIIPAFTSINESLRSNALSWVQDTTQLSYKEALSFNFDAKNNTSSIILDSTYSNQITQNNQTASSHTLTAPLKKENIMPGILKQEVTANYTTVKNSCTQHKNHYDGIEVHNDILERMIQIDKDVLIFKQEGLTITAKPSTLGMEGSKAVVHPNRLTQVIQDVDGNIVTDVSKPGEYIILVSYLGDDYIQSYQDVEFRLSIEPIEDVKKEDESSVENQSPTIHSEDENPSEAQPIQTPNTGDDSTIHLWIGVAGITLVLIIVLIKNRHK